MPSSMNCGRSPAAARTGSPASRPPRSTAPASPASRSASTRSSAITSKSPHAHASKIPANYQRKQTLKNAERYITPELKEYEEKVLSAEEKSQQREYELFLQLRDQVAAQTARLLQTGETLAQLDVLAALAELAVHARLRPAGDRR